MWWGAFTVIPVLGLRHLSRDVPALVASRSPLGQLGDTLRDLRKYPQTWRFLLAFLFFNDGIQTVIVQSSLYATSELGMGTQQVMMTFLLTQFVAVGGALLFGRVAASLGCETDRRRWHRDLAAGCRRWLRTAGGQPGRAARPGRGDRPGDGRDAGAWPARCTAS